MKQRIEEIELAALEEIAKRVSEFSDKIKNGTANADDFITMNEIEQNWRSLRRATENVYTEMVSEMIAAVNG